MGIRQSVEHRELRACDYGAPNAENTLKRIAVGIRRFVLEASEPFLVSGISMGGPIQTQTTKMVMPHLQRQFGNGVGSGVNVPVGTIMAGGAGKTALVAAFMAQRHVGTTIGQNIKDPTHTTTGEIKHGLVTTHLVKLRGTCKDGQAVTDPIPTITSGGTHIGEVRAFLIKYFGHGYGQNITDPAATVTTKNRMALVTVIIGGHHYVIADIGMRMLSPRELFRAQGFADSFQIEINIDGKKITKSDQVRCCGNSVCPPLAEALVEANYDACSTFGNIRTNNYYRR